MVESEIISQYSIFAPFYDEVARSRSHYSTQLILVKEFMRKLDYPINVLDASCATGDVICSLATEYKYINCYGSDICPKFIEKANSKSNCNTRFSTSSWKDLYITFNTLNFDFIYILGNSLLHSKSFEDLQHSLKSIHSILNKGGFFLFDYRDWTKNKKDNIYNGLCQNNSIQLKGNYIYTTVYKFKNNRHHLYHFIRNEVVKGKEEIIDLSFLNITENKLVKVLSDTGFSIVSINSITNNYPFKFILVKKCK